MTTTPTHAYWKRITPEQAQELTNHIVEQDSDEQASALVALVTCLAFEPDGFHREEVCNRVVKTAYRRSMAYECSEDDFLVRAIRQATGSKKGGAR